MSIVNKFVRTLDKVMVFKNVTTWGVKRHPTLGNQYPTIVGFPTEALRDEFINTQLEKVADWKVEFDKVKQHPSGSTSFQNEHNFTFETTVNLQGDGRFSTVADLAKSDFAAIKDEDGNYKFFTLSCQYINTGKVGFQATLEVFFTYRLNKNWFVPSAEAFVEKAHQVRFNKNADGTYNRTYSGVKWETVLRNDIALEPSRLARVYEPDFNGQAKTDTRALTVGELSNWNRVLKNMKWAVFYVSQKGNKTVGTLLDEIFTNVSINNNFTKKFSRHEHDALDTELGNIKEKYTPLVLPYSNDTTEVYVDAWIKNEVTGNFENWKNKMSTIAIINKLTQDKGDRFTRAANLYDLGAVLDGLVWEAVKNGDKVQYRLTFQSSTEPKNVAFNVATASIAGTNPTEYINILALTHINKVKRDYANVALENDIKNRIAEEPALFHPKVHHYELKTWDGSGKKFSVPRMKFDSQGRISVYVTNFFSPTDDSIMYQIEHKPSYQARPLFKGEYLIVSQDDSISTVQTKLDQYYRDNLNTYNTKKYYENLQGNVNISSSITSLIGGAFGSLFGAGAVGGAGLGVGAARGGFSVANAVISKQRNADLRASTIADIKNQLPDIKIGNTANANVITNNNYIERTTGVLLTEMTPEEHELKQIKDSINREGYDVKLAMPIGDLLFSRKAFVNIQATGVLETLALNASQETRQIVDAAFANSIKIFIFRGASTWKGVNVFNQDNSEV